MSLTLHGMSTTRKATPEVAVYSLRLTKELYDRVSEVATVEHRSLAGQIRQLIEEGLAARSEEA